MATVPVLTFHDGKLDVPKKLQQDWKLDEGSELRVVSSSPSLILLEPAEKKSTDANGAMAAWRSLRGILPDRRTPEWEAEALARKARATENREKLYNSPDASTTELRRAEREWELADDELDFGPFPPQ
jgi:hypothetical protein